jgi:hypothetical protein
MGQRLVRVKTKIRDAGITYAVPDRRELPARLEPVLDAIYAAYGSGWDDVAGAEARREGLADEAIWLGRLVTRLLPDEPAASGLLALMLHCEARRAARRDAAGRYVPLDSQDVERWASPMIEEAERALRDAARAGAPGRFQLEAAIQSAHAQRAHSGRTDWDSIALLYEGLVRLAPTLGARVGQAAALAEARDPAEALAALDALPSAAVELSAVLGAPGPPAGTACPRGRGVGRLHAGDRPERGRGGARVPRRQGRRAAEHFVAKGRLDLGKHLQQISVRVTKEQGAVSEGLVGGRREQSDALPHELVGALIDLESGHLECELKRGAAVGGWSICGSQARSRQGQRVVADSIFDPAGRKLS